MSAAGPETPLHSGGCQCGAVRYAVFAEPRRAHLCHCRMCQKAVGNVFAALAPVPRASFRWTRGAPAVFRSSAIAERGFCAACGTPLTFAYVDGDEIDVTIGSLDHPERVPPTRHYGVESRVGWLRLADGLREIRTDEAMSPEQVTRAASCQHPDHDTADDWVPEPPAEHRQG